MRSTFFLIVFFLFISCKKNLDENLRTIQGQLLESSSNPSPISNYTLNFYQRSTSALIRPFYGFIEYINTDNNGHFSFQYDPGRGYGPSNGGVNSNSISIYGMSEIIGDRPFEPIWSQIKPDSNINLGIIYKYKKIERLIRKVTFNNSLHSGESLELISTNGSVANYKTLSGPIASGTILFVDTILNCKLNFFNITEKTYTLSLALIKPQFSKDTIYILNNMDENLRIAEIVY